MEIPPISMVACDDKEMHFAQDCQFADIFLRDSFFPFLCHIVMDFKRFLHIGNKLQSYDTWQNCLLA